MYSKEEETKIKKDFWDSFTTYSTPILKENGKYKWLLYNTRIKGLELKFSVSRKRIGVIMEVNSKSEDRRLRIFEALNDYKLLFDESLPELQWELISQTQLGKPVSEIGTYLCNVDYLNKSHWGLIFAFMSEKMLALETTYLEIFESLKNELKNP